MGGFRISEDSGRHFEARSLPRSNLPPVIVDGQGYAIGTAWTGDAVIIHSAQRFEVRQKKHRLLRRDANCSWNEDLSHKDCPLLLKRHLTSGDAAKTWQLVDYEVLRPDLIPPAGRVILKPVRTEIDRARELYDAQGRPQSIVKVVEELSP